ncbi:MAG: sigma-70 family RNA polymerase sigma factor, partial [Eubacteriales bacterium]|nr:sigma-70 family RNA polymerase sigma factor [Eubacteriales bacterium]
SDSYSKQGGEKMNGYNREEVQAILAKYGDMIYRAAYIQLKNRDHADDIYQEVCIRLLKQKKRMKSEEHLKAWLLRTTINCCKDLWKSAWWQKVDFTEHDPDKDCTNNAEETTGLITECVHRLPEKYRIIIHLYYYEEYSLKEIAQILKIKENTAGTRLARGRNKLKIMLENKEAEKYEF